MLKKSTSLLSRRPLTTCWYIILWLQVGGGQSSVPHKQSKSTALFSPETILPCSSSLESFHVTPRNPRNERKVRKTVCRGRQREAWSSTQIIIMAHGRFEMLLRGGDTAPFLPPLAHSASNHGRALNSICTADNGIWQQFKGIFSEVTEQSHRRRRQTGTPSAPLPSPSLPKAAGAGAAPWAAPLLLLFQWQEDQGGNQKGTAREKSST